MSSICVLGNFVADNSFYADELPKIVSPIAGILVPEKLMSATNIPRTEILLIIQT